MSQRFPTFRKVQHTPLRDLARLQVTGRLNWKSRVEESGLPEIAKQKITDVVKATRLWRLEKSQIADELIAHFEDGQRRGLDVAALVSSFGDTETVATLMRSAKKRNRSLVWKTFVAGCYAFIAFLVFYAGLAVWFFSGKPNPSVDYYAVVSSNATSVPEDQRAWPVYREAWIEHDFVRLNIGQQVGQDEDESWNDWRPGDEKWPAIVRFLDENESLVQAIRRGGQLSGFGLELKRQREYDEADKLALVGPDALDSAAANDDAATEEALLDGALISALLTQVQEMRKMARILETDAFRMADAGSAELVEEDLIAMLGLGPQAAELPFLVCGLVGMALDGIAYNTIQELVTTYPDLLNDRQLATIMNAVENSSPRDYISLEGERAFQLDLIQRIYSDDGTGDGRLTFEGLVKLPQIASQGSTAAQEEFSTVIGIVGPGIAFVSGSRKQAEFALTGIMDEFQVGFDDPVYITPIRDDDWFHDLIAKYSSNDIGTKYFMHLLLPAVEQVRIASERAEGYRNGVLVGLAACRYRLANKKFPDNTDELTPRWIDAIAVDVLTGDPLKYRLRDGMPLIYSVGADHDDDEGGPAVDSLGKIVEDATLHFSTLHSGEIEGDWILWPRAK